MTELRTYMQATAPGSDPRLPSHRCDSCGRDLHVRPIPWELAWPKPGGGHECSDCREARRAP